MLEAGELAPTSPTDPTRPWERRPRGSLHQTAHLTIGRALAALTSFAWMSVVARSLPADAVGGLVLGLTLATVLSVLPDMGLPMIVADRVARHPEETRSLVTVAARRRVLVSLLTGLVLVAMYQMGTDQTLAVPLLMTVSLAATAIHTTATAALRGLGEVAPDALNEVISRVAVLAIGCALLAAGHGIAAAAAVLALADAGSAAVLLRLVWRRTTTGVVASPVVFDWGKVLPLAAALLIGSLLLRVDIWLLSLVGSSADVAHYAIPARLAEGLLLPTGVAAALVIPLTGHARDAATRGQQARRYVFRITAVVALAATILAVFAGPVLEIAFGAEYAADQDVLRLLCLACIPSALSIGLSPIVALHDRRAMIRWVCIALVVDVIANLLLLPALGGVGAAWASIASMTVAAWGMFITTTRLPAVPLHEVPT